MVPSNAVEQQFALYLESKDQRHLSTIFEWVREELMGTARRAGLDEQGAEDVAQETFLAIIEAKDRFEPGRPFMPWIRGIAVRQVQAERRRRARLRMFFCGSEEPVSDESLLASSLNFPDLTKKIEDALESLSPGNRSVVRASLFEGMGVQEMSERFDLTNSAVSVRLHRGLQQLRERLGHRSALGVLAGVPAATGEAPAQVAAKGTAKKAAFMKPLASVVGVGVLALLASRLLGPQDEIPMDVVAAQTTPESQLVDIAAPVASAAEAEPEETPLTEELAAAAQQPELKVKGQVLQSDGIPAPEGVEIFVLETNPDIVLPTSPLVPSAVTDSKGSFMIPASTLTADSTPLLIVRFKDQVGWKDVSAADVAGGTFPTLMLIEETKIEVNVTDENGLPVEGVELAGLTGYSRFIAPLGEMAQRFGFLSIGDYRHLFGGTTNEQGAGKVGSLFGSEAPQMTYFVSLSKPGYATMVRAFRLPQGETVKADLTLTPLTSLSFEGRVIDELGAPLPGSVARIMLRGEAPVPPTAMPTEGAAATWSVPNTLLDTYPLIVRFECPGYVPEELFMEAPEQLSPELYTVVLLRETPFEVTVLDEAGEPVPDATVAIATAGGADSFTTDEDGRCRISGFRRAHRVVSVSATGADGSERSVALSMGLEERQLTVTLPTAPHRLRTFEVAYAGDSEWKFASLRSDEVPGFMGSLTPRDVTEQGAVFESVPKGSWIFSGLTLAGTPVIQSLNVEVDADPGGSSVITATTKQVEVPPVAPGTVDCLIVKDHYPADMQLNLDGCTVAMRRVDIPRQPDWLISGDDFMWTELSQERDPASVMRMYSLAAGKWSLSVSGAGWSTAPVTLDVKSGEVTRLDLDPVPSGLVSLHRPSPSSAGLGRFNVRRNAREPWQLAALVPFGHGHASTLDVTLPPGTWQWRSDMQTVGANQNYVDLYPPTYGTIKVTAGEQVAVDAGTAEITPPD